MKILIADDHRLVLEAVRSKLSELEPGIEFVLVMTVPELLARFIGDQQQRDAFDLALIDIQMPGADGQRHILEVRRRCPELRLVVLSGHEDPALMREALEQGAQGFIPKAYSPDVLLAAVRLVLAGGVYVPPMMLPTLPPERQAVLLARDPANQRGVGATTNERAALDRLHELLTARQLEVLQLLSQGKPNKLIGRSLSISEGTVKIHLAAIFRALNVGNRTEAVIAARALTQQQAWPPSTALVETTTGE